jgi:sulfate adenylyltransferase large subunit
MSTAQDLPLPPQPVLAGEGTRSIADFLAEEQAKDILRFSTAGSVDDGKSTLIGRLLYDSRNVYEDHVRAVTRHDATHGANFVDFAQLTDGLRAEREQGITIDVAYRFFSTAKRKFIIADTPGHEQYTRNMATGASTSDLAIILVDARKGVLTQSRRHLYIASLLGIPHVVAAINKMDLVGFAEEVFDNHTAELRRIAAELGIHDLLTIPVSALRGDNVVERSSNMPWYTGPSLLEYLENVPLSTIDAGLGFRLPVQRVIRPHQHYRGFAGQIAAGSVRPGDPVVVLPSGRKSRVKSITTFDGDLASAGAPLSIALTLDDELDISRGDLVAAAGAPPVVTDRFEASLVWMDAQPFRATKRYRLKHTTQTTTVRSISIRLRIDIETFEEETQLTFEMNAIGLVEIQTGRPILADEYRQNRVTGSFILIDPDTNATVAAGMVRTLHAPSASASARNSLDSHCIVVELGNGGDLADGVERDLFALGYAVVRSRMETQELIRRMRTFGGLVILHESGILAENKIRIRSIDSEVEPVSFEFTYEGDLPSTVTQIVSKITARLQQGGNNS